MCLYVCECFGCKWTVLQSCLCVHWAVHCFACVLEMAGVHTPLLLNEWGGRLMESLPSLSVVWGHLCTSVFYIFLENNDFFFFSFFSFFFFFYYYYYFWCWGSICHCYFLFFFMVYFFFFSFFFSVFLLFFFFCTLSCQ